MEFITKHYQILRKLRTKLGHQDFTSSPWTHSVTRRAPVWKPRIFCQYLKKEILINKNKITTICYIDWQISQLFQRVVFWYLKRYKIIYFYSLCRVDGKGGGGSKFEVYRIRVLATILHDFFFLLLNTKGLLPCWLD